MLSVPVILALVSVSAHAQFLGLVPVGPMNPLPARPTVPAPVTSGLTGSYKLPAFCNGLDCPMFTVLETNDNFEVRRYAPSVWVATKKAIMLYSDTERRALFYKLFHYISGNNSANMNIPMTAPVLTEIEHGQGPDCESNFTMQFMMPYNLYGNPPAPTEAGVFIRNLPAKIVIVKTYGGFSDDRIKQMVLEKFIQQLDAAGKRYEDRVFYTAGYDGPYQFTNRHNEIWVAAK